MKTYDFKQHIHNFSVWTAARSQRAFTKTAQIKRSIEDCGLRLYAESLNDCNEEDFNQFHKKCANQIIQNFKGQGIECSYGRAAKIIAIYLKTSVIIPHGQSQNRCSNIHSPIDRILLNNLKGKIKDVKKYTWTKLKEEDYWELMNKLKSKGLPINWTLEEYWTPTNE